MASRRARSGLCCPPLPSARWQGVFSPASRSITCRRIWSASSAWACRRSGLLLLASSLDTPAVLTFATLCFGFSFGSEGDIVGYLVARNFALGGLWVGARAVDPRDVDRGFVRRGAAQRDADFDRRLRFLPCDLRDNRASGLVHAVAAKKRKAVGLTAKSYLGEGRSPTSENCAPTGVRCLPRPLGWAPACR